MAELISPETLREALLGPNPPTAIDVRGEAEFRAGHIPGAVHIPGDEVERSLGRIPKERPVVPY